MFQELEQKLNEINAKLGRLDDKLDIFIKEVREGRTSSDKADQNFAADAESRAAQVVLTKERVAKKADEKATIVLPGKAKKAKKTRG